MLLSVFDRSFLISSLFALLLLLAFPLLAGRAPVVTADGSSTVFPLTEAVAEEFQIAERSQIQVTVGVSGTGGGFKKFCRRETDLQNASRPILKAEIENCQKSGVTFYELPVAYDALVVVTNPQNSWVDYLTTQELKKMWAPEAKGVIKTWADIRPTWPKTPLKLYGPGSDSGTFDYFTEAIVGKAKSSRGDYTASEDDNTIVQGVTQDPGAIGYFGYAYYESNRNKLKLIPIKNGKEAITPSEKTVKNGQYQPLARPIFIYINAQAYQDKQAVKKFTHFYLQQAAQLAQEIKYIALSAPTYLELQKQVEKGATGTRFNGHSEVGLKIEDLIQRARQ